MKAFLLICLLLASTLLISPVSALTYGHVGSGGTGPKGKPVVPCTPYKACLPGNRPPGNKEKPSVPCPPGTPYKSCFSRNKPPMPEPCKTYNRKCPP